MAQRTCSVDGCGRPHQARGMCGPHYGTWHRQTFGRADKMFAKVCIQCGAEWMTRRSEAKYCSVKCKGDAYRSRVTELPPEHPVMALIAEARKPKPKSQKVEWRTARQCPGCAAWFCPLYTSTTVCCTKRCARRVSRWRRNAAERNAPGSFTWSEFMRIAQRFQFCCAYCGVKPGRLDPDHVVPLSRGGINSTTNLLPACPTCNGDKRDLLLSEWAEDRERRGKEARATSWVSEDRRYWHLTQAMLAA